MDHADSGDRDSLPGPRAGGSDDTTPDVSEPPRDAGMAELVDLFLSELVCRADRLRDALADQDLEQLRTIAHQLKGAAGGYGFPVIGFAAAAVEQASAESLLDEEALVARVYELVGLCERASSGRR